MELCISRRVEIWFFKIEIVKVKLHMKQWGNVLHDLLYEF